MPFGISSASEVLQKRAYQVFGDIPGVHIMSDDMLIAAKDEKEHDQIFENVLERARKNN
ncbi:Retrovirus-related Pol poly from transposon, partial [Biomphalaria pfeifferi]